MFIRDLYRLAKERLRQIDRTCLSWLQEAEERGELRPGVAAEALAPLVASLLFGLRVDARAGESRTGLEARWETFLSLVARTNHEGGEAT